MERPINGTADFIKRPKAEIDEDAKSDVPRQYDTYEWASDDDEDKIAIYEVVKPAVGFRMLANFNYCFLVCVRHQKRPRNASCFASKR